MSEDKQPLGLANLPKFGSFWSRPEGKLGCGVLSLMSIAVLVGGYYLFPILLEVVWTGTKLLTLSGGLFATFMLVTNKRIRNLASNAFQAFMEKLVKWGAKTDPYGIVRRYIKYLKGRVTSIDEKIAIVSGQRQGLVQVINQQTKEVGALVQNLTFAREKKKMSDDDPYVKGVAARIGRKQKSTAKLQFELERDNKVLDALKRVRADCVFVVEDKEDEIETLIRDHSMVSANDAAVGDAIAIINGDPEKKELFDAAVSHMAEDMAMKIGRIETGLESIQTVLTTKELESDAAAAAVLTSLDEATQSIRGTKTNAMLEPVRVASDSHTAPANEFEELFSGRKR
jgi:hypothetical protein